MLASGAVFSVALCSQVECWKDWEHKKEKRIAVPWRALGSTFNSLTQGKRVQLLQVLLSVPMVHRDSRRNRKIASPSEPLQATCLQVIHHICTGTDGNWPPEGFSWLIPPPLLGVTDLQGFNVPSGILWTLPLPINSTDGKHLLPAYIALGQKPEVQTWNKAIQWVCWIIPRCSFPALSTRSPAGRLESALWVANGVSCLLKEAFLSWTHFYFWRWLKFCH